MKKQPFILLATICLQSCCTKQAQNDVPIKVSSKVQWVHDLQQKNPLKDSANYTSVYFRFDTIINNYEVSGVLYPRCNEENRWEAHESGVRLFFHSLQTGKEYIWTNMDYPDEDYKPYFMSINVVNIIYDKRFKGFKNGDAYIFHYNTTIDTTSDNSLLPYAEYQFYDANFDGKDELMLGYYTGGPHGSPGFDMYDITDSGFAIKNEVDGEFFSIDNSTKFDSINKIITCTLYDGAYAWGVYGYKVDEKGDVYRWYNASFVSDFNHNILSSDTTFYR